MTKNNKQIKLSDKTPRRNFIKKAALGAGALSAFGAFGFPNSISESSGQKVEENNLHDLQLKFAGYDFDRVIALTNGKVKVKGCSLSFEKSGIGDTNTNIFIGPQTFDFAEIGLIPFMLAYANDNFRDYTLLPVFPLRVFRHKSVFIRTDRGINKPEDLKGRTIGTPGYSSTSLTWIRGIFQDEYGIDPKDIKWVTSAKDSAAATVGKVSKNEQLVPEGISMVTGPAGMDESELLELGEVDALFHAAEPKAFVKGYPNIGRLFPNYKKVEQAYFSKTGIFPIMHAVAVRKELLEKHPWLDKAIFDAYSEAKKIDFQFLRKLGWAYESLPWFAYEMEETQTLMGKDFWPYGIEANRKALETICRYCYEQGLIKQKVSFEHLFLPASFEFAEE